MRTKSLQYLIVAINSFLENGSKARVTLFDKSNGEKKHIYNAVLPGSIGVHVCVCVCVSGGEGMRKRGCVGEVCSKLGTGRVQIFNNGNGRFSLSLFLSVCLCLCLSVSLSLSLSLSRRSISCLRVSLGSGR